MAIIKIKNEENRDDKKQNCIKLLKANGAGHKILDDEGRGRILIQVPDEEVALGIKGQLPEGVDVIEGTNWNWLWPEEKKS